MLQEVNNLKVRVRTDPERQLCGGERERAMTRLRSGKDINLEKPTRDLGLPSGAVFNLARGGRKVVKGDESAARMMKEKGRQGRELFGGRWLSLSPDDRNEIVRFMLDTEDPEAVRRKATDEWGLDDAQAEAVANTALPSGYVNLSEKAIRKLLPHLERDLVYSDAVKAAGYRHHSDFRNAEAHERLPYYGEVLERDVVGANPNLTDGAGNNVDRHGRIGNPTVHVGLNQLRRVVNRLAETYGKPEGIVVELARDLKSNREQKLEYERRQREGGERNERLRKDLEAAEVPVTHDILGKLRLWEEQGSVHARVCPYSGRTLSFDMVVSAATEVDHILPFSKTLDDSISNKVVCIADANRDKGDRSPHEAFGHNPPGYDYEEIRARAARLPDNKRWRFDPDAMARFDDEREFLDRQLNETRYLSRTARTYLAHMYDEKREGRQKVFVVPGRMTALLRRGWGLEGMLRANEDGEIVRKQRNDHRHHAIDAFVVANTTQGLLQRFQQAAGSSHDSEDRLAAVAGSVLPWDGFDRNDLRPFLDNLVVSYKPDRGTRGAKGKTTGQLHNETAYGLIEYSEDGPSEVVVRKKLTDFKRRGDIDAVRDGTLRTALLELWDKVHWEGGKAADFAEKAANEGVLLGGGRRPVRSVRVVENLKVVAIKDRDGRPYKGYKSDSNAFADIWEMRDRGWKIVVVSTFDANGPDFNIEAFRPVTSRGGHRGKPDPVAKPIMRLYKDDMGALGDGAPRRIVRIRKFNAGSVVLDSHNEAGVDARERKGEIERGIGIYSPKRLREEGFRKVRVDEIGRVVWDPGPPEL